jgi:hypothetical protein
MYGFSHGQPQVLTKIDPDQEKYNDEAQAAFQRYVDYAQCVDRELADLPEARKRQHLTNRALYVREIEALRAKYGQREVERLLV